MPHTARPLAVLGLCLAALAGPTAQDTAPNRRTVTVVARDGRFEPDRIEVVKDDLVTIHLRSEGTPHSFAIDAYRLMKRAGAGETVTFQFRADQVGQFVYYCSLSTDPQCADMKGTLVVAER
ncbi:MAG: cupredoxin domain-containing protein [Vicinamibacterales bacterium]